MPDLKVIGSNVEDYGNFNERIARWDAYRINFLSFIINLIFTLTGGSFWIWYQVLKDDRVGNYHTYFFISSIMLGLSFILGILTMLNRLRDFRLTAKTIRLEQNHDEKIKLRNPANDDNVKNLIESKIKELDTLIILHRIWTRKIGNFTYCFFYTQVGCFVIGNGFIVFAVMKAYNLF